MKKLLTLFAVALAALPFYAEIYFPHRYVDFGLDLSIEADENLIGAKDIFVKNLVIDLPKICDDLDKDGFVFNMHQNMNLFMDVNINGYGGGLTIGESIAMSFNLGQDFFRFLAYGNYGDSDSDTSIDMQMMFEAYTDVSVPVHLKFGKLRITATPSYYIPIVYLPNTKATVSLTTMDDGSMTAEANADLNFYSVLDLANCVSADESGNTNFNPTNLPIGDLKNDPMSIFSDSAGFDLKARAEYALLDNLDVGGYVNVPLFPGSLKHRLSATAKISANLDPILDYYTNGEPKEEGQNPWHINPENPKDMFSGFKTDSSEKFYINRPFRLGIEAAFRPFGNNWFFIHPKLGLAMRNPFGKDFSIASIYPEYSLEVQASLFDVLGLNLCTQYTDKVFMHSLGIFANLRIMELKLQIGTGSGSFLKSFNLSGVKASLGFSFGF